MRQGIIKVVAGASKLKVVVFKLVDLVLKLLAGRPFLPLCPAPTSSFHAVAWGRHGHTGIVMTARHEIPYFRRPWSDVSDAALRQ